MQLLNKTTGIVEYNGPIHHFQGVEAYHHPEVNAEFDILLSDDEKRDVVRQRIAQKAGDQPTILGTTSDAALIALDHLAMDILAIDKSATTSSYKTARIALYEEWHGPGKWALAVADAHQWFQGRKAGVIKSPVDVKGQRALESIAQRSTAVAEVLAEAQSAT